MKFIAAAGAARQAHAEHVVGCRNTLVPKARYDVQPTYYVYGGLVFCPLTLNYLYTWGDDWAEDAPYNLLTYFVEEEPSREGEEVVIIIKVLATDFNNGYDDLANRRIRRSTGKRSATFRISSGPWRQAAETHLWCLRQSMIRPSPSTAKRRKRRMMKFCRPIESAKIDHQISKDGKHR